MVKQDFLLVVENKNGFELLSSAMKLNFSHYGADSQEIKPQEIPGEV